MSNAGIYDVLLTIVLAIVIVALAMLFERYRMLQREVNVLRSEAHGRKAAISALRAHQPTPRVDSKVRTTRRDTDDLPVTGRMSQGVKRIRTTYDSSSDDNRLPEGP